MQNIEIANRINKAVELVVTASNADESQNTAFKAFIVAKKERAKAIATAKDYVRGLKADLKVGTERDRARRSLVEKLIESGLKKQRVSDLLKECGWPSGKKAKSDGTPRYNPPEGALEEVFALLAKWEEDASQQEKLARAAWVSLKNGNSGESEE